MSILSLPRLKTILDRLSATRAAYLDNLQYFDSTVGGRIDTNVASRAPATSALSTSVWTSTKAGYINREINPSPGAAITAASPTPHPDAEPSTSIDATTDLATRVIGNLAAPGATWTSVASPAGPAMVSLLVLVVEQSTGSSTGCEFRVTIDGTTVYTSVTRDLAVGEQTYFVPIGEYQYDKTAGNARLLSFEEVTYNTQMLIEARNVSNTGVCTLYAYGAGRKFV